MTVQLPFNFGASRLVDAYLETLVAAPPCPKCGGDRKRDVRLNHTLHVPSVSQRCPQ